MSAEDEVKEEMGEVASSSSGMRLRHSVPRAGDDESRLVALELNVERLQRGILLVSRQIDDLRKQIGGG